jgi:phosphate transport system substrate-binding protein
VKATADQIMAGRYPLVRPFLFVVKGELNAKAQAFVDFVLSDEGQKILEKEGLIRTKPATSKLVSTTRPD